MPLRQLQEQALQPSGSVLAHPEERVIHSPDKKAQILLDTASHKLYYVNYEMGQDSFLWITPAYLLGTTPALFF